MVAIMKRYIILLILLSFQIVLAAQSGNGSSGNPFTGDISTSVTWSTGVFTNDEIYIGTSAAPNLRVISDGHLTIDEGVTIIFARSNSNLIVTGSGILDVTGTSVNPVLFTKHPDNTRWGHISFETPGSGTPITGTGSFEYAIFEYGYAATSGTDPSNAGGAIQINAKDVTIDNCIFRYNYSNFGGAVTVNAGTDRNTIIRNSYFHDNTANQAGGALLTWTNSTPIIENCIFEANHCNGVGSTVYSGGAVWSLQNTTKIVNCTFVENTSDRAGDAVYSYSSSNMRIVNSILWGSDDQFAGSSTTSTIVTCAFETSKPSNAANSITISATASDHFVDAGNSDWTLKFISPCRDAGTTPSPTVTSDYNGDPRIGNYDIGAYEVQYSRWTGTTNTTWTTATNWAQSVDPSTGTGDIIIPTGLTNYPTGSTTQDYIIGANKQMIIEQGARVTLNDLTNNGIIKLNHAQNASGFASLIINNYTRGTGATEEIQLFLSGGGTVEEDNYKWHYISSPVSSLSTDVFTGVTLDLAQFIESRPSTSVLEGWVAYDGYVYFGGGPGPTFSTLSVGQGYNFWDGADNTFTFPGLFNTGDKVLPLGFSGDASLHGFNLLGNPYSSGLNWNDVVNSTYFTYPDNTSKGLYFTRDNVQCSYINGVGIPGDVTGIIPPMQGFFTKTYSTSNSITLPAAARTHTNIHSRYKGEVIIPLVRLSVFETTVSNDETVVRFDELAKSYLDNDFDAIKMFLSSTKTTIHSALDGIKYAINGLPYPEDGSSYDIPIVVNLTTTGNHKISATQLQGLDGYSVTLKDNTTGYTIDLKTTPEITFNSASGLISDRFILSVGNVITGMENPVSKPGDFIIYDSYGFINIIPNGDNWNNTPGSVRLFDLTGKTVGHYNNAIITRDELIKIESPNKTGLYFVEISSGVKRYVGKVVVK